MKLLKKDLENFSFQKNFSLQKFPLKNKTVFVRVDYNVPVEKGKIIDSTKIKKSLQTIKFLLQQNCKIVLTTHFGRPNGKFTSRLKVDILAKELQKLLPKNKITKVDDCVGKNVKEKINQAQQKEIIFLENLRFHKEEENNNSVFAHSLADLAEIYVNEAFGACHRKHASIDAITTFLPSLPGFLLQKEIEQLNKALKPRRKSVWIMGGAKLNKIDLINQALKKADYILIGGALAFSFLKAKGISVGMSKTDIKSIKTVKKILKKKNAKKIILPIDFIVSETFSQKANSEEVMYYQIKTNQIALDLGPETTELFKRYLRKAHTIVWNGPLGYFEWNKFATSTKEIARFITKLTATTICGGGETAEAIYKYHLDDKITHISTGGGATLEFLAGKKLPGIIALEKNYKKFKKKSKS